MTRVTLLASDLGATAGASLAAALAAHPRGRYSPTLVAIRYTPSTAATYLYRLGVPAMLCPIRGPFDVAGMLALRATVAASRPDVLHLIGTRAGHLTPLLPKTQCLVVSHGQIRGRPIRFDECAILPDDGVTADLTRFGLPAVARVILAVGDFSPDSGLREAVWAFEVLRHVAPGWHLLLAGDGPGRAAVERFAYSLGFDDIRTHFTGQIADLPAVRRAVDCVWVTARRGGQTAKLEALAQNVPVLGYDSPAARWSGVAPAALAPAGDPVRLAHLTRDWIAGKLRLGGGHSSQVGFAGAEAVAARAAAVYTA